MTETLHRPGNAKAETRALRLRQTKTGTQHVESFSEPLDTSRLDRDFIEQQLASIEELSPDSTDYLVSDNGTTPPRMTDAMRGAFQEFTLDSRGNGNDPHTEALKEYRKWDKDRYIDHIAKLSDSENSATTPEARDTATSLLAREHFKADMIESKDKLLQKVDKTSRTLGRAALRTGFVGLGLAKVGYKKAEGKVWDKAFEIDGKVSNWNSQRTYEKSVSRLEKETAKSNKKLDKQAVRDQKRGARVDRAFERSMKRKETVERVFNKVEKAAENTVRIKRRLGSFAAKMESVGRGDVPVAVVAPAPVTPNTQPKPEQKRSEKEAVVYNVSSLPTTEQYSGKSTLL